MAGLKGREVEWVGILRHPISASMNMQAYNLTFSAQKPSKVSLFREPTDRRDTPVSLGGSRVKVALWIVTVPSLLWIK
jgi:hypothetical protein